MANVYVIGVGMTPFGKHLNLSVKDLTCRAVTAALRDAGCSQTGIQAAFFANSCQGHMEGQHSIRGQIALRAMGFAGIPMFNVENACAGGASALHLAVQYLRAGAADVAMAVGTEKLFSDDKALMFKAFDSGWDIETKEENHARLVALGRGVMPPPGTVSDQPYSMFMDVYAAIGRHHMREYGTTQRQFAAVAAKNHLHSVHNELSQYRRPFTVDEILQSAPITYPLTLPMCSPISDGAAAAVLCTDAAVHRFDSGRAVRVLASIVRTGTEREPGQTDRHITHLAAQEAYAQAGVGPGEISVAEVHDATAIGEIIQIENLGFCGFGEGGLAAEMGATQIGGRIPVNPSGGLESRGHPVAATGLAQIHELVMQLRQEAGPRQIAGAKLAVAENGGGLYGIEEAVAALTVLSR